MLPVDCWESHRCSKRFDYSAGVGQLPRLQPQPVPEHVVERLRKRKGAAAVGSETAVAAGAGAGAEATRTRLGDIDAGAKRRAGFASGALRGRKGIRHSWGLPQVKLG